AGGRGFESRPLRQIKTAAVARLQRFFLWAICSTKIPQPLQLQDLNQIRLQRFMGKRWQL
ncbi:hypothetical protein J8G26_16395, partial [Acidovorax sp. JG5]|uniref:hypothetical protein n=1 Tax=Acidovorax sp. JG5 TaxID=2822718 RepID=UPI001B32B99F